MATRRATLQDGTPARFDHGVGIQKIMEEHGLESRLPFLDHPLVELVMLLHYCQRVHRQAVVVVMSLSRHRRARRQIAVVVKLLHYCQKGHLQIAVVVMSD